MNSADTNIQNAFNLDLYFELSPDLLCIAGYDGYFKRINPTVSKTLGYTNDELYSQKISDFIYLDDKEHTAKNRANLTNNNPLLHFENRYLTKSGEIVWLSWTSVPIHSENLVFAIAKNITHKKKHEEDRNSQIANLTKINSDLKRLNYTASHDLRTPVNNLLAVFNLLDVSKINDDETLEFLGILKTATENLKNTMDNYVDVLKAKDSLYVEIEELSLTQCFEFMMLSLRSLIKDSRAFINYDFSAFDTVTFNKAYLQSIFLNLVTNSIKYAKHHIPAQISVYSKFDDGIKQIVFKDEGQGFDLDKVKSKIFGFNQRFHDNADSKGIGLYLVYNHITSLGGSILLDSKPNEGSAFIISFKTN